MVYDLAGRLVVGIASSALFDLGESREMFQQYGEDDYRRYQEEHLNEPLPPGVSFSFIKRLLSLNDLSDEDNPLVEVIILSRNSPDTGLRVMRSVQHYGLSITRAVFMQGQSPYTFMPAFNMSLFLSANDADVRRAVEAGFPAGVVLGSAAVDEDESDELRIAFDFDGVLADDSSDQIMKSSGLAQFHQHEMDHVAEAIKPGPLKDFLSGVNKIQALEKERKNTDKDYTARVRVVIVTARNAPSHERAVRSLKTWGVTVNDAFFLGGVEKAKVLSILKPHIFFDDLQDHLVPASKVAPSVHIPFGVANTATGHQQLIVETPTGD